jgi:DNA-binding transcriptional ArsR family regulator
MNICADIEMEERMQKDLCDCRIVHPEKVELARTLLGELGNVEEISQFFKAFGDPGRLQIVHALHAQEMCVCDLAALLGTSESAVSHQLRFLRTMGLVANRRDGVVLYYRLTNRRLVDLLLLAKDLAASR